MSKQTREGIWTQRENLLLKLFAERYLAIGLSPKDVWF